MREVRVSPRAKLEIEEAMAYLHQQREDLPSKLTWCLAEGLQKIREWPQLYPFIWNDYRKFRVDPFK